MGPLPPPNMGLTDDADESGYSPAEPTPNSSGAPARTNSPPSNLTSSSSDSLGRRAFSSPKELGRSKENLTPPVEKVEIVVNGDVTDEDMKTLREMGFSETNIRKAMKAAKGNTLEAAQLLMEEAKAKMQGLLERKSATNSLTNSSASINNNLTN